MVMGKQTKVKNDFMDHIILISKSYSLLTRIRRIFTRSIWKFNCSFLIWLSCEVHRILVIDEEIFFKLPDLWSNWVLAGKDLKKSCICRNAILKKIVNNTIFSCYWRDTESIGTHSKENIEKNFFLCSKQV